MHDPTERRFTAFDEQTLRKSLAYKSTSELREKLADVICASQTASKKSVTELKQDLKDMRAAETAGRDTSVSRSCLKDLQQSEPFLGCRRSCLP